MTPSVLQDITVFQDMTFHLLRPWWLLAILPALLFSWSLRRRQSQQNKWMSVIDSELLTALLDTHDQQQQKNYTTPILLAAWLLAIVALAGPSFEKTPQAAVKQADALVILLDLSPSMLGQDVKPSRLQAAHYKVLDLLRERREGYTGLIAYSGSAHVVAPLSDDANTISALVDTLEPGIMPSFGSNTENAVDEALQLLKNSHFDKGRILLITDGVESEAVDYISKALQDHAVQLSVISVGTETGAPIELQDGSFLKDKNGKTIINKIDSSTLRKLADVNGGYYSHIQSNDSDIAPLLTSTPLANGINSQRDASHTVNNWKDNGYWLVLPCLVLALFFFKRGVLLCILPLLVLTHHDTTYANDALPDTGWQDWWLTPDQQAEAALKKGDTAAAAEKFSDSQWKGYAEYQNSRHKEAAENFSKLNTPVANYNRGNALAQLGDYQEAIHSYEKSLKQQPNFPDASFNLDLVRKLLAQQKQDKNNQKQQDQQQQDQQQQDQQQQDKQNQQQQNQQQQDQQNQQQQDQQNQQQQDQQNQQQQDQQNQQQQDQQQESQERQVEQNHQDQQKKEISDKEQTGSKNQKDDSENISASDSMSDAEREKAQATEQWLRKVPDDPGGLLKNKFEYYYRLNRQRAASGQQPESTQQGEQRW